MRAMAHVNERGLGSANKYSYANTLQGNLELFLKSSYLHSHVVVSRCCTQEDSK